LPYIEMRPRCCVLIAVSPDDGGASGGGTVGAGAGAGVGGAGSGARSSCAQPNSIAQASAATRYDDGRERGPHAGIVDSCTSKPEVYNGTARTTGSTGTVCFDSQELWGTDADPTVKVSIDAFEPYLEHV
jgi:hypothetical protein